MKSKTPEKYPSRPPVFYLDGGAGRILCAIPALEYYALTHYNFSIITHQKEEFFKENSILYKYVHSIDEPGLFDNVIKDGQMIMLEPYMRYEYYNQECSLIQAFDLEINGDYCIDNKAPRLYFSRIEEVDAQTNIKKIKKDYKSPDKPVIIFQPFGASAQVFDDGIFDYTNRSFVMENIVDIIQLLRQDYLIIWMGDKRLNISNHTNPICYVNEMSLREWAGYIKYADHFLGCDSVGQHLAKAVGQKSTVVIGSTYPINISYPNDDMVTIFDIGESRRVYEPIRITMDQAQSEKNQGIMLMGNATIDNLIQSIHGDCPSSKANDKFFEIRKTFVDYSNDQGNPNFELFFKGKDPNNIWSHTQEPDADEIAPFLKRYTLPKNITVLDSGCGEGKNIRLLKQFDNVYGVDISQTAIDNAQKEFPNVNFSAQDVADLNFANEKFNVIIDAGCLHSNHPMQHPKIINQYHRILKPNGKLFFRVCNINSDDNTTPVFYFDLGKYQFSTGEKGKIPIYGLNQKLIKKLTDGLFELDEGLWSSDNDEHGINYIYFSKINR